MSSNNRKRLWAPFTSMSEWDGVRVATLYEIRDPMGNVIPQHAACIASGAPHGRIAISWVNPQTKETIYMDGVSNRDVMVVP